MNNSPALVDGTQALTTSYFRMEDGPKGQKETREQKHKRQQAEAEARAAAVQKRYDYVHINNAGTNIGSKRNIIQERPAPAPSKAKTSTRASQQPRSVSIKNGGIPMPVGPIHLGQTKVPNVTVDANQPGDKELPLIKPLEETREQRLKRQHNEAVAKAAALQKQFNLPSKVNNVGSMRNIIQEKAQSEEDETAALAGVEPVSEEENRFNDIVARAAALKKQAADMAQPNAQPLQHTQVNTNTDNESNRFNEAVARASAIKKQQATEKVPPVTPEQATPPEQAIPRTPNSAPMPSPRRRSTTRPPSPPRAPPDTWQASLPNHQMDAKDLAYLQQEGYPLGLIQAMTELKSDFAKQIWIIDNSESMTTRDGTMLASGEHRFLHKCTRWDELQECVSSHIRLAGALKQPTSFRLLNDPGPALGPQRFGICESVVSTIQGEVDSCLKIMARNYPMGQTPLALHINHIIDEVTEMRAGLLASGKRVAIVICTDGVPTDLPRDSFLKRLRVLETLPVWLVVRLCTNEPHVVDYYNQLDEELKIQVDVIDDFQGEALDICKKNPWLNYGLPLHRARERGFHARVLDFLDECPLSKAEQKEVCGVIFGKEKMEGCPEPDVDMPRFLTRIEALQEGEELQWDPIEGKVQPWVDFVGNPKQKLRKMGNLKRKKTSSFFGCFGM